MIEALLSLDGALLLTHERDGEDEAPRIITDRAAFLDYSSDQDLGPMLRGPHLECTVSFGNRVNSTCSCEIDLSAEETKRFILHMAAAMPTFGYACSSAEREHRNRLYVKTDQGLLEYWVGRDVDRYIPGLYWLTLLSGQLADVHGVSLAALERAAIFHVDAPGDMHLYQFYDSPGVWQEAAHIEDLLRLPGIFHIDDARTAVGGKHSLIEVMSIAREWR